MRTRPTKWVRVGRSHTCLGLFALKDIDGGQVIAKYAGKLFSRQEALGRNASHLCVLPGSGSVIDGTRLEGGSRHPQGGGCMQMANHREGTSANARRHDAKAGATVGTNQLSALGQVHLVATKPIASGQEITFDYGSTYSAW
jgi:hypothetical protein